MVGEVESYIRQSAQRYGIDPNVAVRVASGEGGLHDPFRHGEGPAPRSQASGFGSRENSFGPFQLYISGTGSGLGDRAVASGIDPRRDWKGGIDYALNEASQKGWGQWYGAKAQGITGFHGIGGRGGGSAGAHQGYGDRSSLTEAVADRNGSSGGDPTTYSPLQISLAQRAAVPLPAGGNYDAPTIDIGVKKKSDLADALIAQGNDLGSHARNPWDVIGGLAQVWAGNRERGKIDAQNAGVTEQEQAAQREQLAYDRGRDQIGDEYRNSQLQMQQENNRVEDQNAQAMANYGAQKDARALNIDEQHRTEDRQDMRAAAGAKQSRVLTDEEASQLGLPQGQSYQVDGSNKISPISTPKGQTINVTNGRDESEFSKKAADQQVKRYGEIADTGTAATHTMQTIPVMRELLSQAPNGPLAGRLADAFPGFNSAADAFKATVNQIAPSLRIPGSGAQSDRDMDIILGSFPRLQNNPEANAAIMDVLEKKAQLNYQRSDIANKALRGEIEPAEADRQISAIDQTSILPDQLRASMGIGVKPPAASDAAQPEAKAIGSQAEYDALPSGSVFRAPDGSVRRKP